MSNLTFSFAIICFMDEFFSYVSKGVIIVPIIIIILSLIFKFNQPKTLNSTNIISPTLIVSPTAAANSLGIDITKSWICHYKEKNQEYMLLINRGKIDLEATVSGQFKKYDLSPYSSIISNLLKMDVNQLESFVKPYLPEGVDFKSLINSCEEK